MKTALFITAFSFLSATAQAQETVDPDLSH